jgi:hypothetical protein
VVSGSPINSRNEATPKPYITQEQVDAFARNVHDEGDVTSRVPKCIDKMEQGSLLKIRIRYLMSEIRPNLAGFDDTILSKRIGQAHHPNRDGSVYRK